MQKVIALLTIFLLTGCGSLIPKRVEFGQDKVQKFPEPSKARREAERQAISLAAEKAREAERIAAADGSEAEAPAGDAAELAEAVGRSLGPPAKPWKREVDELTRKLDELTAKHNELLLEFKKQNDENVGKKIEGTGWLSVPYFVWVGGALLIIFVLLTLAKIALSILSVMNPGVAVGLNVARASGRTVSAALSQVIRGGESFKRRLAESAELTDAQKQEILNLFRDAQRIEQAPEVQTMVKELTK